MDLLSKQNLCSPQLNQNKLPLKIFSQNAMQIIMGSQNQTNSLSHLEVLKNNDIPKPSFTLAPKKNLRVITFPEEENKMDRNIQISPQSQSKLTFLEKRRTQTLHQQGDEQLTTESYSQSLIKSLPPQVQKSEEIQKERPKLKFNIRRGSLIDDMQSNDSLFSQNKIDSEVSTNIYESLSLSMIPRERGIQKSNSIGLSHHHENVLSPRKGILKRRSDEQNIPENKQVQFRETTNVLNINNGSQVREKLSDIYRIKKKAVLQRQISPNMDILD